ncbi:MAG: TetR/AcrR family transcriptional regulator [Acidovorax soli]|uniref:TetR/AcrR family transcriptional regulator n=1 Tax=Acidovorax soli TaxID=592050 RepID=UPI0026EDDE92|nr:TetR/AcrR family transcriptional regulator [Acidovorax soli]MCM2347132.1 TetR/AcrR family transcriptional regulator [Acidovorax soli]
MSNTSTATATDPCATSEEHPREMQQLAQVRPKRNQRLPKIVREQQIQMAALKVFREKGYHAGSISEIAKAAGLAEGALYKFYRSKKEILEAVICAWYEITLKEYEINFGSISNPYQRLRYAIAHNLRCLCEDVAIANLYLELRRDHYFRSSRLVGYNKKYIGLMKSTIQKIQDSNPGITRGTRPSLVVEMIYSMVETKSELYRMGERDINEEDVVSQIYELALKVI